MTLRGGGMQSQLILLTINTQVTQYSVYHEYLCKASFG